MFSRSVAHDGNRHPAVRTREAVSPRIVGGVRADRRGPSGGGPPGKYVDRNGGDRHVGDRFPKRLVGDLTADDARARQREVDSIERPADPANWIGLAGLRVVCRWPYCSGK